MMPAWGNELTANGSTGTISFTIPNTASTRSLFDWACLPPWPIQDREKLIADFKLRIKAYKKALFQKKPHVTPKEHSQPIICRQPLQRQNHKGTATRE